MTSAFTKQIRNNGSTLQALREVWLRIDRIDGDLSHPLPGSLTPDMISAALQLGGHLTSSPGGIIRMEVIHNGLALKFSIGYQLGFIVDAGSVDTTEICGHADRNLSLVSRRTELRTKFTLVVRSKLFLQIFFEPVHLHGELTDLLT